MGASLYLTPPTIPTDFVCRRVKIPNDVNFLAAVNAALLELTLSWRWQSFDGGSVSDTVDAAKALFDDYVRSTGCGMVGVVFASARSSLPDGSLACDGATYLKSDYPELYDVLGAAYIVDASHFKTPDLRGRVVVGSGQGSGLSNRSQGQIGGEEVHTLSSGEMPIHAHIWGNGFAAAPGPTVVATFGPNVGQNTGNAGSGGSHNNMQPFEVLSYGIWFR